MTPHIIHIRDGGKRWWVIGDGEHTVRGTLAESKVEVVAKWEAAHGRPTAGYVRIRGYCRLSEAAATLGSLRTKRELSEGGAR